MPGPAGLATVRSRFSERPKSQKIRWMVTDKGHLGWISGLHMYTNSYTNTLVCTQITYIHEHTHTQTQQSAR